MRPPPATRCCPAKAHPTRARVHSPRVEDAKERGRRAYANRAWGDAYDALSSASAEGPLDLDDVERLAFSAGLAGHEASAIESFERLHQCCIDAGEVQRAVRAAFWATMRSFAFGERARGSGWLARAQRLVGETTEDCVEHGYVRLPDVFRFTAAGDHAAARLAAREAADVAIRYGDRDLTALARTFEGRALIREGRPSEGLPILDDAMLAVTSGQLSPVVTGIVYCAVIAACQESYAHDRAREWTEALRRWCDEQPQLVPFAGQCLIHRSEILLLGGNWREAAVEAHRASRWLSGTKNPEAGNAFYQEAELHRLRGELSEAERIYAMASDRGRDPQPGLSLLRLAQGRVDIAAATSKRVLSTVVDSLQRAQYLPAHVEIMLAAGNIDEARCSADELGTIAKALGVGMVDAMAEHANGIVTLAQEDARGAIAPLRRAQDIWQGIGATYLVARIRFAIARAFQALGDEDGATLELDAARKTFVNLGASPDVAAIDAVSSRAPKQSSTNGSSGLSVRELEVLRLVATGKSNKVIARALFLSERTIDRHVSNIFTKLNVTSRAAATAWAFQNGVVG
ncbi:MAG: response regulator transcription factor [Polyangiaceae bacterium]|nr:response regulator transcription factor [Polyangiaceae bacterium]